MGSKAYDGTIRGREYHFRMSIGGLQSCPRIHRRLYLLVDALEGSESNVERGDVSQVNWWMGLIHLFYKTECIKPKRVLTTF